MGRFRVFKHGDEPFICGCCGKDVYDHLLIRSGEPEVLRKQQVLMLIVRCDACKRSSMVYHTKVERFELIDDKSLGVS